MDFPDIQYQWFQFEQLGIDDLYDLMQLRQQVFVVEQDCPYLDADGVDQHSYHLLVRQADEEHCLVGYLRIIEPGRKYPEPAIGRVVTDESFRGKGLGRALVSEAIHYLEDVHPGFPVRISAQLYLNQFYQSLGFKVVSEPYDEDGIPHIEMIYSS